MTTEHFHPLQLSFAYYAFQSSYQGAHKDTMCKGIECACAIINYRMRFFN